MKVKIELLGLVHIKGVNECAIIIEAFDIVSEKATIVSGLHK